TSLVVVDKPRPPVEQERIEEAGNKTENHTALWGCIRSRTQHGDKCTISLLRDDMKRLGYDVKNMRRWLAKLEKDETIRIDGDDVVPL
ncbi:DNA primase, partial [Escherichia coli]|nr:DNA primase [Escherichia coli]EHK3390171.1 DNA primase [Escherichia coli]